MENFILFRKIFFVILILQMHDFVLASQSSCNLNEFNVVVNSNKRFFNIFQDSLSLSRNDCDLKIIYDHFGKGVLVKEWNIDFCREPIHVKFTDFWGTHVLKKKDECDENNLIDDFCKNVDELFLLLQDQGLIFAKGNRAIEASDHGKVYCGYLMTKQYLQQNSIGRELINSNDKRQVDHSRETENKIQQVEEKTDNPPKDNNNNNEEGDF